MRLPAPLIRWLSVRTRLDSSDSQAVRCHGAYALKAVTESRDSIGHDDSQPPRVRPEALGSPEGYAVLPGHRLLWPHPSLWIRNGAISAFSHETAPEKRPRAAIQRFPNLLRKTVRPCRLPYPGGFVIAFGCCFLTNSGLRHEYKWLGIRNVLFEAAEFA
jgi:hypothetical protein